MKKNNLVAITFAFAAAVAGIFIACTKEAEPATPLMSKGVAVYEAQLDEMFRSFWAHCDYAYEEKHEMFFEACMDEDMDGFLDVTGLQRDFIRQMTSIANGIIEERLREDPNLLDDVEVCETCGQASLMDIYHNIAEINTLRSSILDMDPSYADSIVCKLPPEKDECMYRCKNFSYTSEKMLYNCYINCLLGSIIPDLHLIKENLMKLEHDAKL